MKTIISLIPQLKIREGSDYSFSKSFSFAVMLDNFKMIREMNKKWVVAIRVDIEGSNWESSFNEKRKS